MGVGRILGFTLAVALAAVAQQWNAQGPAAITSPTLSGGALAGPMAALAQPPGAPSGTILAGGIGGVWSYSAGAWSWLGLAQPVSALAISPSGAIFAGTGDVNHGVLNRVGSGIFSSTDGGASWQSLSPPTFAGLAITAIALDPVNSNHVLAAAVTVPGSPAGVAGGLFASSDSGASWSLALPGNVWSVAINPNGMVLAAGATAIELSNDDGVTFSPVSGAQLPSSWSRAAATVSGSEFLLLLDAARPALVQIGSDGSMAAVPSMPTNLFDEGGAALAVAAGTSSTLWVGGTHLWASANAGTAWTDDNTAPGAVVWSEQHAILLASDGSCWLANDGGVARILPGRAPVSLNPGLNTPAPVTFAFSGQNVVAALIGGGVATGPTAVNATWTNPSPLQFSSLHADPTDPSGQSLWGFAPANGTLYHSVNGGAAWSPISAPLPSTVNATLASSSGVLYLAAANGLLWSSSNGGASFSQLAPPAGASGALTAFAAAANPATLWIAYDGADGTDLWASRDGGATWSALATLGGVTALAADPAAPNCLAALLDAGPEVSCDAGVTWTPTPAGLPGAPVTSLAWDNAGNLWASTLGAGLWDTPAAVTDLTLTLAPLPASAPVASSVPLQATLTAFGHPSAGATVSFSLSTASGSAWSGSAVTNSSGIAQVTATLPNTAGTVTVTASLNAAVQSNANLQAVPLPPSSLVVISGGNQSQVAGAQLPVPIVIAAEDTYANFVPGVAVTLSASAGAFSAPSLTTGTDGQVSVNYTLPTAVGLVTLTATAGAVSLKWIETATSPPGYSLSLLPPSTAVAPGQNAVLILTVTAVGGYATPVSLVCTSPTPGCTITPATLAPGASATVTVDTAVFDSSQTQAMVEVQSDATHSVSVMLPLESLTLSLANAALNLTGTAAATDPVTLSSVNGASGTATLAVTQSDGTALPAALAAALQPATVPLTSAAPSASASLVLTAAATSAATPLQYLLLLVFLPLFLRRRRIAVVFAAALLAAACSGSAAPIAPPPVPAPTIANYTLQVTATLGNLSIATPLSVTVTTP